MLKHFPKVLERKSHHETSAVDQVLQMSYRVSVLAGGLLNGNGTEQLAKKEKREKSLNRIGLSWGWSFINGSTAFSIYIANASFYILFRMLELILDK